MTSSREASSLLLIEAAESGKLDLLSLALSQGANPDARKKLNLKCAVKVARTLKRTLLRSDILESKIEDKIEQREDSVLGESALLLAVVRSGRADVVSALLVAGANPDLVCEWHVANFANVWTPTEWDSRWQRSFRYSSVLEIALMTSDHAFSKPGPIVELNSPRVWQDVLDRYSLVPDADVVQALLDKGAHVSTRTLELARNLRDNGAPNFLEMCEKYRAAQELTLSCLSASDEEFSRMLASAKSESQGLAASPTMSTSTLYLPDSIPTTPAVPVFRETDLSLPRPPLSYSSVPAPSSRSPTALTLSNSHLLRTIAPLRSQLQSLESENRSLREQLSSTSTQLSSSQKDLSQALSELAACRAQLHKTQVELQASRIRDIEQAKLIRLARPVVCCVLQYAPHTRDELAMSIGDRIAVEEVFSDNWAKGENLTTQLVGVFPTNFTTSLPETFPHMSMKSALSNSHRSPSMYYSSPEGGPDSSIADVVGPPPSSDFEESKKRNRLGIDDDPDVWDQVDASLPESAHSWLFEEPNVSPTFLPAPHPGLHSVPDFASSSQPQPTVGGFRRSPVSSTNSVQPKAVRSSSLRRAPWRPEGHNALGTTLDDRHSVTSEGSFDTET
ncbi:hypothetical protein HDU93_001471 [Gonapodya sp. JEL0774]|nr:hypothetical protein HDU93_001471 [Gonapodya sp. JEL0774]